MDDFSDIPHGIRLSNSVLKNRPVKFSRKPAAKQVLNEYHGKYKIENLTYE